MVLLSVMSDNIIDSLDSRPDKIIQQNVRFVRVNRIKQRDFLAALYQVGVITGAVRQRNQFIEQPPVPVNRPHRIYIWFNLVGHKSKSF